VTQEPRTPLEAARALWQVDQENPTVLGDLIRDLGQAKRIEEKRAEQEAGAA
jgi:hypothetical protein